MSYSFHKDCEGPIRGFHLPPYVWGVLRREGVVTQDQLHAVASHHHWVPGIGFRTARVIRAELARVATIEKQHKGGNGLSVLGSPISKAVGTAPLSEAKWDAMDE